MSDVVLEKHFVCTDSKYGTQGHNKRWSVKVYSNGCLDTEYGRVGDVGATTHKDFGTEAKALKEAEKLIKKKQRGKKKPDGSRDSVYQEVEIVTTVGTTKSVASVGNDTFKKIANNDPVVESLIAYLDKQNIHNITNNTDISYDSTTGLFSTPLGVVGQKNIDDARDILAKIKPHVGKNNAKGDTLAEQFMMLIPQNIGRRRPTLSAICRDTDKYDSLNSILDSLQASLDIVNTPKPTDDSKELDFGVTVSQMLDSNIRKRIEKFYNKTRQSKHSCYHLDVDKVWTVEHKGMNAAYDTNVHLGNVMELWHGTRVANVLSILSKGMCIPPSSASHCTGRMFGDGLYFSDQSTKSLNYAYGYWDGKGKDNHCFMFLFDVIMGKMYKPQGYNRSGLPKPGYDSTFAEGGVSSVMNNEMIVYDASQCRPTYLVEFKG